MVVADKVNEMKARSSIFYILLLMVGILPTLSYSAEQQAGDGCGVNIQQSLPGYNVMNSDAGHVVETVLADTCTEAYLNVSPIQYSKYCECNKVNPTDVEKEQFDIFMKRRVGLKKALDEKAELEGSHGTSSFLVFDSLAKLKENSIAYPETCSDLMKIEKAGYKSCMEGDRLNELKSISKLNEPKDFFKRIVPEDYDRYYEGSQFDILTYFGFGGTKGSPNEKKFDINHTTNPTKAKINRVLAENDQFKIAQEIIGPAIGTVFDKYNVKLNELIFDQEVENSEKRFNDASQSISNKFVNNIAKENSGKVLLAVGHEFFGSGPFNEQSLGMTVKLRVKAMDYAIKNNTSGQNVLNDTLTSGQYLSSPFFVRTMLESMAAKAKEKYDSENKLSDKEISDLLKGKKINDLFTEDERKELYQKSISEVFLKVIKNFKDLGALCTDYRNNFNKICGDNTFEDEKYNGSDFIEHALVFNPKGAGVKIMCEKALDHLKSNSDSANTVELDERGFLGYLEHLGGIKIADDANADGSSGPRYSMVVGDASQDSTVVKPGQGGFLSSTYDMYRGMFSPRPKPNSPDRSGQPSGDGSNSNGSGTRSYQITNFSEPDVDRGVLVDAIIKNDENKIRSVMESRFGDGPAKPVFGNQKKAGFIENLESDVSNNGNKEIEDFISKNFAMYDSNDSSKDINKDFYSGDNSIFANDGLFNTNNVPTRPVEFDELSDEEKKEYNDAIEELDKKIEEGEKLADQGEKSLEEKETDKERAALQKQLDDLRKSIDQLKKKKEVLQTSVVKDEDRSVARSRNDQSRGPASIDDKKYVSTVSNSSPFRAATIKNTAPNFGGGSSSSGGSGGSYSGGSTTPVAYVDGAGGYAGTIVTDGNKVGKELTKKNPGPESKEAVNYDKLILERTSVVLAPDVFSSYGQEQFDQYYRDHGTDPIVVKKQVEVVIGDKKETKDVYVYYFPEMKDGKINYVKRDPAAVMGAIQTVKSKKKVDAELDLVNRDIARHDELVTLFKAVID